MKKKLIATGLILVILLVPVSCAAPAPAPAPAPTPAPVPTPMPTPEPTPYSTVSIPIEEFRNQPHIDVVMHGRAGGGLTVALGSNPTTGFRWSELAEISDETIIQQISHMYVGKDYETPPPPGTSGEEVWIFKALQRGTTTIYLEYSRPWVEEEIGYWTVTITVNIR